MIRPKLRRLQWIVYPGLAAVAFGYGVTVGTYQTFPFEQIKHVKKLVVKPLERKAKVSQKTKTKPLPEAKKRQPKPKPSTIVKGQGGKYDFHNDPIGQAFYGRVPPFVDNILKRYLASRLYSTDQFPLETRQYYDYKRKIKSALINSMSGPDGAGEKWVVEDNSNKTSTISDKFEKTYIDTVNVKGSDIELYTVKIKATGDVIPYAMCIPEQRPAPAVVLFSGHTAEGGLRDLFVDDDSYQKGLARTLCENGFATLAIEKIDSGLVTMHFNRGDRWKREDEPGGGADDELEAATTLLGIGDYLIPGRQLMVNIAAVEILAADKRVDHRRIGAAGVSLGGWLTLHTALVNSRIKAVANFGGMWAYLDHVSGNRGRREFEGINDFSQLIPGIWKLGDQNRFILAAAPLVMMTGYGELDKPYIDYKKFFFPVVQQQYNALGAEENLEVVVHEQGHTFPVARIVDFFRRRLCLENRQSKCGLT